MAWLEQEDREIYVAISECKKNYLVWISLFLVPTNNLFLNVPRDRRESCPRLERRI